nr:hypothetical protein [Sphingomonas bacterium]
MIDERPKLADITAGPEFTSKFFSGAPWQPSAPSLSLYQQRGDSLCMGLNGVLTTASRRSQPGLLPLLPGSAPFYVEFTVRLSGNNRDHWPAVWLMPIEHDLRQSDREVGDPPKYERWLELDVDEGGFHNGPHGVAISWKGIWPHYERQISANDKDQPVLFDRTRWHRFGLSYDPKTLTARWWLDGVERKSAGPPFIPQIARKHRFFLIMSAASHAKRLPFEMCVSSVKAFA